MFIHSLLDTDLYKFTMMQTVLHNFPSAMVRYDFKCRNPGVDLSPYAEEIKAAIADLCTLRFNKEELSYLAQFPFFKSDYIEFLRLFQLNNDFVSVSTSYPFELTIRGPWLHTILFEVPILAIIGEIYYRNTQPNFDFTRGRQNLEDKCNLILGDKRNQGFRFSEFGTRRRFSYGWHKEVIGTISQRLAGYMTGSSNVLFAKEFDLKPIGTMAHEYLQACQALGPRLLDSQRYAFEVWAQEYRGQLGIALSDVFTLEVFLKDFDLYFCKLFDGARHDSGDPIKWGRRVIDHYTKNHVDPKTKTLVFSDCLTFERALKILYAFEKESNPVFGIGTHLTNDVGIDPLQNVIKMTYCNGQPVVKLSDSTEKVICLDETYLSYLQHLFKPGEPT